LFASLAALLFLTSREMFIAYQQIQQGTSVARCAQSHSQDAICDALTSDFRNQFGGASILLLGLTILPALAGMFLGAPLIAREVERGTFRLAWTQGITRTHWVLVQVGSLLGGVIVVFTAFSLLLTWWRGPLDQVSGDRFANGFDLEGAAPVAYAVFAIALGIFIGVLVRRTLPAMALTLGGFVVLRGVIEFGLRPQYVPPIARISDPAVGNPDHYNGDWVFNNGFSYVDRAGHPVSSADAVNMCSGTAKGAALDFTTCLQQRGIRFLNHYQPADRFWLFQGIESTIFVALAVVLLALAIWWVRSHIA
jgi:hypothetical protein